VRWTGIGGEGLSGNAEGGPSPLEKDGAFHVNQYLRAGYVYLGSITPVRKMCGVEESRHQRVCHAAGRQVAHAP
jgi:hypothetical protein